MKTKTKTKGITLPDWPKFKVVSQDKKSIVIMDRAEVSAIIGKKFIQQLEEGTEQITLSGDWRSFQLYTEEESVRDAAPELLAALEAIAEHDPDDETMDDPRATAKWAIAKAKGK